MEKTLKNAIATAKRQMIRFGGRTTIKDIAYGIEYQYGLQKEETDILIVKMEKYNETKCCGIYR